MLVHKRMKELSLFSIELGNIFLINNERTINFTLTSEKGDIAIFCKNVVDDAIRRA